MLEAILAATLLLSTDWPTIIKAVDTQVVRIEIMQGESTGTCTGSVIDAVRGFILTAAHCVPQGDKGEFSMTANRRDAQIVRVNRILDLAILRFAARGETAIELAPSTPPDGTEVAVVGFGFGTRKVAKQFGHISAGITDDESGVWIDVATLQGDSGGPVIDAQGRQVAMSSSILYNGPAHISHAVRIEDIRDFVVGFVAAR